MKYGELTLGQIEAIVNKHGGMDGIQRFLRGKTKIVEVESENKKSNERSVSVPAVVKNFVVAEHFKEDAKGFLYLSPNFKEWFLPQTVLPRESYRISYHEFIEDSTCLMLFKEDPHQNSKQIETDLSAIFYLMFLSPALVVNSHANLFFVRDISGTLCIVEVFRSDNYGWTVRAHYVLSSHNFKKNGLVFHPES